MQIQSLSIRNFKSIRELEILDVESSLILVGKNNTGKHYRVDKMLKISLTDAGYFGVSNDGVLSEKISRTVSCLNRRLLLIMDL